MSDTTTMDAVLRARVLRHLYRDSVALLRIASTTERLDGIVRVGAVMATPANVAILAQSDMLPAALDATADDLVFVVRGQDEQTVTEALDAAEAALTVAETGAGHHAAQLPGTIPEGIAAAERDKGVTATLAAVSVPGTYASVVAEQSLRHGLHVLCFSDNVPVADEVHLKSIAVERQLLMMGPDCGTAILDGVPLGFANVVRRGRIGIVAASGTGAQEVSRLIDAAGGGVSQLIGVGGRDLSAEVGGLMTDLALGFLVDDAETDVIVVVSKPPAGEVADRLIKRLSRIAAAGKPTVACFLGLDDSAPATPATQVCIRGTLEGGAMAAASLDGHPFEVDDAVTANFERPSGRILGLFTGGTLASEAKLIVQRGGASAEVLDLGDDQYTAGKPHPMIDPDARATRIAQAGADPSVGIILIDVVLGFGAAADPATPVADAVRSARHAAGIDGRRIAVIGSICGTDGDPQSLARQRDILESAGVILCQTNAAAARLALALTQAEHGVEARA
jgi:FdrA protein